MIDNVSVSILIQDAKVTAAGFGTAMILDEHTAFTDRTKSYADLTEVAVDFAAATKIYKAANAIFAQSPAPQSINVGRIDAGDADITATLNAIALVDLDWYGLLLTSRVTADILAAAAWTEANGKIFGFAVEDADVLTSATTDVFSVLQALGYNRTFGIYHHKSGQDPVVSTIEGDGITYTLTTASPHTILAGDIVTVSQAAIVPLGDYTVDSVTSTTIVFSATGATTASIPFTGIFYRYTAVEAAWMGLQFAKDPGTSTWKFKTLAGITATPKTSMDSAELAIAEGKGANIYVERAGVSITREGIMVSGRFIDITRGVDWLDARMEERIFTELVNLEKIPYTNEGMTIIESAMREVLNLALSRGVINPVSDSADYILTVPNVFDIPVADRTNRLFPDIGFQALVGNSVHGVTVTGTLRV